MRVFLLVFIALGLISYSCPAEGFTLYEQHEAITPVLPQLASNNYQTVINLSGPWEYRVGEKGPFQRGWIPSSFENNDEPVVFRRSFSLADSLKKCNFQIYIPGIHYSVEVWLNGSFISAFTGSHLAFNSNIPRDRLRFGSPNEILLRIDNRLTPRTTFPVRTQLLHSQNYGGIFSGVYLRAIPDWAIECMNLEAESLQDTSAVRSHVRVRIAQYRSLSWTSDSAQSPHEVRIYTTLRDSLGRLVAEGWSEKITRGGSEDFQVTIPLSKSTVSLWSPEKPVLYQLTATLIAGGDSLHQLTQRMGFKRFEIANGDFYINGRQLRLRGIDYIPEYLSSKRAVSPAALHQDLTRIRDLRMNVIRIPFGPPPLELLNCADEIGLMVLPETGLDWIPPEILSQTTYADLVQHSVTRLLAACESHVSVLAWGLGSQLDWNAAATRDLGQRLYSYIKSQDKRPCYIESSRTEDLTGLADFRLSSWSPNGREPQISAFEMSSGPLVYSRLGQLASMGKNAQGKTSSGNVVQAEYLIRNVLSLEANTQVDGYLIHSFADYHGASPLLTQPGQKDRTLFSYGIVGVDRQERMAYAKLRDLAQTGQSAPPPPRTQEGNAPIAYPIIGLAALLLLSAEIRRNNVFRQNLKRVFLHAHGFYSDLRYRRFLHMAQPLLLWLLESVTLAILTASALYAARTSFTLDYYLTHFISAPRTKDWLVSLIWNPVDSLVYFTGFFMVLILVKAAFIRLFSLLFRERVDFWQSANYVVWAFAALLFILPLGVVFYRVLDMPNFRDIAWVIVIAGLIWCAIRLLSALRTGFAANPIRVYATVLGIVGAMLLFLVVFLNNQLGTMTYLSFIYDVFAIR